MIKQEAFEVNQAGGTFLCILAREEKNGPSADHILRVKFGSTSTWSEVNPRDIREWASERGYPIVMELGYI